MTAAELKLFNSLGHDYTTADARQAAKTIGMAWKTAERYLGNFTGRYHVAQRVKNGHYRKR